LKNDLIKACKNNDSDIVLKMLTFLNESSFGEDDEIISNLINNIDDNDYKRFPLMIASEKGYLKVCELLLSHSAIDVNTFDNLGKTALMNTSRNGHSEVVRLLLSHNDIDVNIPNNIYGMTALMYASHRGHSEVFKLLLSHSDIDVNLSNYNGKTALMYACSYGQKTLSSSLMMRKSSVNKSDNKGT
jgi:ankyrin repeat protein